MNERSMRNLGLSRRELFETIERDALIALPADNWEFAEWRRAQVNLDNHIEVQDFLYSVPHALIRAEVDVRITARTGEIFHRSQRVGAHTMGRRRHGTDPDHMPSAHRRYVEWTPDRFRRWAGKSGWIAERRNLLVIGASGQGKSWLDCALGHKACRENLFALYTRMPRLFADLAIAHGMRATPGSCAPWRVSNCSSWMMGTRSAHSRSCARPARNRRGSLRQGLDLYHQPGSCGPLA
jgi:hypothetical protein